MRQTQSKDNSSFQRVENSIPGNNEGTEAFAALERGVHAALETYSNVHRGSGHKSMVTTYLFEQARNIVLEYLGLSKVKYTVIFCTPRRASVLKEQIKPESYQSLSSKDIGLPLGVRALAVRKKALPRGTPFQTGGGTTRLISPGWVIWAGAPDKFEAGTPAIINVIAFAKALNLIRQFGKDIFLSSGPEQRTAIDILYHDKLEGYSGRKLLYEIRQTLIGHGMLVPTVEGTKPYINLDNSASTPTCIPVWNAVLQTWRQNRKVDKDIIHEVKSICSGMLGAPPDVYEVIFTSNTTESVNLVAETLKVESGQDIEPVVLNTLLEHSSNDLPWREVAGFSLIRLKVDADGFMDLKELDRLLYSYNKLGQKGKKRIKIVAVSGASNVLGIYNNLLEISKIVHHYGAHLMVDAAQMVAHRKVEMERCGIDYLAFSAHKVYAPFGCGVLVVRKGLLHISSAELELIQSSGEENTGGIVALGKALALLQRIGLDLIRQEEQELTAHALRGMAKIYGLRIFGIKDPDSHKFLQKGGVIVFSLKSIMPNQLAKELAEQGAIGVRYGCHCAHILIKHLLRVGPLLEGFQGLILTLFPKLKLPGLVRVSLGIENSKEDVDTLIHLLGQISGKQKKSANGSNASDKKSKQILRKAEIQQQMDNFTTNASQRVYAHL